MASISPLGGACLPAHFAILISTQFSCTTGLWNLSRLCSISVKQTAKERKGTGNFFLKILKNVNTIFPHKRKRQYTDQNNQPYVVQKLIVAAKCLS